MALRINYKYEKKYLAEGDFADTYFVSQTIPDAYVKICAVSGSKDWVDMRVQFYESGTSKLQKTYRFTPSVADGSENFIRQGYEYLKTLPEFSRAVDC